MALGATTYKTPNMVNQIYEDLSGKEGCGVYLDGANTVDWAKSTTDVPYGIIVVGADIVDVGGGPYPVAASALELVDQLGCVVQVLISSTYYVYAGELLLIDNGDADGTFASTYNHPAAAGDWIWGIALTDALPGEQCLMRFQPYKIQYVAP